MTPGDFAYLLVSKAKNAKHKAWAKKNMLATATVFENVQRDLSDKRVQTPTQASTVSGDMESWAKFLKLGEKYAKALCSGKLGGRTQGKYTQGRYTLSVRLDDTTFKRSSFSLVRGSIYGKPATSDGHIAIPCELPPDFDGPVEPLPIEEVAKIAAKDSEPVNIEYVPAFADSVMLSTSAYRDEHLVILSDGSGVRPLELAAAISAVGSPYTILHAVPFLRYEGAKKVMNYMQPGLVSGPKGTALFTPARLQKHAL
jgi:hypothetical protein